MAKPAARAELSAGFLRRHPAQGLSSGLDPRIRDEDLVRNKAVYLALGVAADGTKDILSLWIETTEGAKFWLKVMNDLKAPRGRGHPDRRGRRDLPLKFHPKAIRASADFTPWGAGGATWDRRS